MQIQQSSEKTGRTVDEAVGQALSELGISRDEAEIEILEEPARGFLGLLGSKPARVRVKAKNSPSMRAVEITRGILKSIDMSADIEVKEKDSGLMVSLEGEELGILIGRRGETLDALQYLLNLAVNKNQEHRKKIVLDIEGYRKRREETLRKLANKLAEKARQRGRNVVLEPMNSLERRIIHMALQGRDDIATFSEGEEPYRKIIISPRK